MNAVTAAPHPVFYIAIALFLALLPLLAGVGTAYLKVSIVLGVLRSGLGTTQIPGNLVIGALAFGITLQIMHPVFERSLKAGEGITIASLAQTPLHEIPGAVNRVVEPWRDFLRAHSGPREIHFLQEMTKPPSIQPHEGRVRILLGAFLLSELKDAFRMGFFILLPFVAIDLIVANLLVGLGMMMVSPVMIALPLKLLLLVYTDGWLLIVKGLISSYGVQ